LKQLKRFLSCLGLLGFLQTANIPTVLAEGIERIDVVKHEKNADLIIKFDHKVQYLRHTPPKSGKDLRIFIRLVGGNIHEEDIFQTSVTSPKTEGVPDATVVYPELIHAMLVNFSVPTTYTVRLGDDAQSILITVPLLPSEAKANTPKVVDKSTAPAVNMQPVPAATATPAIKTTTATADATETQSTDPTPSGDTLSTEQVEAIAAQLMSDTHKALAAKDTAKTISLLNQVLSLPKNTQTEPAQALMADTRVASGEIAKAKAEYELYLKLFPTGPSAEKAKRWLANPPKGSASVTALAKARAAKAAETKPAEWTYSANLSSYYYTGKSQVDTIAPPPPGQLTFSQSSFSLTDQKSLISQVNLTARKRDPIADTRIIFRATRNDNYLDSTRNYNRIYSAYVEHTDRDIGYFARAGRQNPNGNGALERFDGLQGYYEFMPGWRIGGIAGDAAEFLSPFKKSFWGMNVEKVAENGLPGVSLYAIEQKLDDLLNRRAIGADVRYFDGKLSAFGTYDYDTLYKSTNIALAQLNYLTSTGTNYFVYLDHRRAPSLSLTNALLASPGLSIKDIVSAQGLEQTRRQVVNLSAISDMVDVGFTHPIYEHWQVGGDYRISSISATQSVNVVIPLAVIGTCLGTVDVATDNCLFNTDAQQGSGKSHVWTGQLIGSDFWMPNSVISTSLSLIRAPTYNGESSFISMGIPLKNQFRLDTNLRHYSQNGENGSSQRRLSPSLKLSWQWLNKLYLEIEGGYESSRSQAFGTNDKSRRDYMYMGMRWDMSSGQ